ncbi:hypothetical protein PBRA_009272 [Plasmodiophora brassicae]|uniref:Uncharacterized protein n=1 Tax=Plasmodiophora brassicae TaxID=37360 RepID=A0A0G4J6N7_PLABS|nr:hypothetical protein PBRA_009272 [Plasmodiophora brassicae]
MPLLPNDSAWLYASTSTGSGPSSSMRQCATDELALTPRTACEPKGPVVRARFEVLVVGHPSSVPSSAFLASSYISSMTTICLRQREVGAIFVATCGINEAILDKDVRRYTGLANTIGKCRVALGISMEPWSGFPVLATSSNTDDGSMARRRCTP